jgi:thiosulfate/3-mercaptopyruvate sulfurtransferase
MKRVNNKAHPNIGNVAIVVFLLALACVSMGGRQEAFALDMALMEPSQLHGSLGEWTVLDARPRKEWKAGHIQGALPFTWEDHVKAENFGASYRTPAAKDLAGALGRMGIHEKTPVVVYGDADESWGGEGWSSWVLAWLGHKGPIRVLNGGVQAWKERGYPLVGKGREGGREPVEYRMTVRHELDIPAPQIEARGNSIVVIDTRSSLEWMTGHLPFAIHSPWSDFHAGKARRPLDREAFRKLLADHGVDPAKPIVYYCTAGVRSAYAWMVHTLTGHHMARNYVGGMSDWKEFSARKTTRKGV